MKAKGFILRGMQLDVLQQAVFGTASCLAAAAALTMGVWRGHSAPLEATRQQDWVLSLNISQVACMVSPLYTQWVPNFCRTESCFKASLMQILPEHHKGSWPGLLQQPPPCPLPACRPSYQFSAHSLPVLLLRTQPSSSSTSTVAPLIYKQAWKN